MNAINYLEWTLLKDFQKSLSLEEKLVLKEYFKTLDFVPKTDTERRHYNMVGMAFIEGVRFGRRHATKLD